MTQEQATQAYKVGDYVQHDKGGGNFEVGILYETDNHAGGYRMQLPDGTKVKNIPFASFKPATSDQIAAYQAAAIEGMTPEAIIAREEAEWGAKEEAAKEEAAKEEDDED